jgi:hypothetical protein
VGRLREAMPVSAMTEQFAVWRWLTPQVKP